MCANAGKLVGGVSGWSILYWILAGGTGIVSLLWVGISLQVSKASLLKLHSTGGIPLTLGEKVSIKLNFT